MDDEIKEFCEFAMIDGEEVFSIVSYLLRSIRPTNNKLLTFLSVIFIFLIILSLSPSIIMLFQSLSFPTQIDVCEQTMKTLLFKL